MRRMWIVALALALPRAAASSDLDADAFRSKKHGIRFEVSQAWDLHRQTGYPAILALLIHREVEASISLTVGPLRPREAVAALIRRNLKGLATLQIQEAGTRRTVHAGREVWTVELAYRNRRLLQLYMLHEHRFVVLTLSASASEIGPLRDDLYATLESLELSTPESERAPAPVPGRGGAGLDTRPNVGPSAPSSGPSSAPGQPPPSTRPSSGPQPEALDEMPTLDEPPKK